MPVPRTNVPGISWPALVDPRAAGLLALQHQLDESQWWSPAELRAHQDEQLGLLLRHAATTVPHYRRALKGLPLDGSPVTDELWARVPLLSRAHLQRSRRKMRSTAIPASHGAVVEVMTSGSTGQPVQVAQTEVIRTLWLALTLREHRWHRRDLTAKLGVIRHIEGDRARPPGHQGVGWGPAVDLIYPKAPVAALRIDATIEEQAAWLLREDPDYLLTHPTALHALCDHLDRTGARPTRLRQARTLSETLSDATRDRVREVLGVGIADVYSSQELGYVALQCPDHPHYHVQSESVRVEVLREDGTACAPGETGRLVVTSLHNYATPLIRYGLGDHATVGTPCACGRGLPVLERILGRTRNMVVYPDGSTRWPLLLSSGLTRAAPYRQLQALQDRVDHLVLRVVPDGELTAAHRAALADEVRRTLAYDFQVDVEVVSALSRSASGKFEEFVCQVPRA